MYDIKCHELAEAFLSDEPEPMQTAKNIARLAQTIQTAIEDEIESIRQDAEREAKYTESAA